MTESELAIAQIAEGMTLISALIVLQAQERGLNFKDEMVFELERFSKALEDEDPSVPLSKRLDIVLLKNLAKILRGQPTGGGSRWSPELIIGGLRDVA
jgi:hypothetical protein